jgi:hypothetical protein
MRATAERWATEKEQQIERGSADSVLSHNSNCHGEI